VGYSFVLFQCRISRTELVVDARGLVKCSLACNYWAMDSAYTPFVVSDFYVDSDMAGNAIAMSLFFELCADGELEENLVRAMEYVKLHLCSCVAGDTKEQCKAVADFVSNVLQKDAESIVLEIGDKCRSLLGKLESKENRKPLKVVYSEFPCWLYRVICILNEDKSCSATVTEYADLCYKWEYLLCTEKREVALRSPVKFIRRCQDESKFEVMVPQHGERCQVEYLKQLLAERIGKYYTDIDDEKVSEMVAKFGEVIKRGAG